MMLFSAVFRTDLYEIRLQKVGANWDITVYSIKHSCREFVSSHTVKSYSTAYLYIQDKYLAGVA